MNGDFDPNVLAALPPSMQLDLLVHVSARIYCLLIFFSAWHFGLFLFNILFILMFVIDVLRRQEKD
jgi:hypothetical protein